MSMFRKTIILLFIIMCIPLPAAHGGDRVSFGCRSLEKAMQQITGRDYVTVSDMQAVLGEVNLSNLGITSIKGLEYLQNAASLDISSNEITDITPVTNLKALHRLNVSGNRLKTLPVDIDLMESLEELDISGNPLEDVPRQLADIPQLKNLVADDCGLRDLPELQPLSDTLKWLSLSGNKLLDYSTLLNLSALELLRLERCSLPVLPDISLLGNLSYLYLNENDLESLPAYLGGLPLVRLEAKYNRLSNLPDSFAGLSGLKQLILTGNAFAQTPDIVLALQGLEVLMLDSNMISSVPAELSRITSLCRVSFTSNDIGSLDRLVNFRPSSPGQVSFKLNRLDMACMDTASIFVMAGLKNVTGIQKEGEVELDIIKADTQSIDMVLSFSMQPDAELDGGELVPVEIRLYNMATGFPEYLQSYAPSLGSVFSYKERLAENQSYKLRALLVMKYTGDPYRLVFYHDDAVIFELAPAPAQFVNTGEPPVR